MATELAALEANHTWDVVPLPPGKRVVSCKWLYKTKYNPDGTVERLKARLVARGFSQTPGLDFFETFAPVAKMTTIRLLLALSAMFDWNLTQMDVTNAFLHGDLSEEVYMAIPPGYSHPLLSQPSSHTYVCKLLKSLYGLRQAPRCWFQKFASVLLAYGFKQAHSDHSLFLFVQSQSFIAVLVYVDDILVAGNDVTAIKVLKNHLATNFKIDPFFQSMFNHVRVNLYVCSVLVMYNLGCQNQIFYIQTVRA